jgi:hypothetical protein
MDEETRAEMATGDNPPAETHDDPSGEGISDVAIWGSARADQPARPPEPVLRLSGDHTGAGAGAEAADEPPESKWWPVAGPSAPLEAEPPSHRGRNVAIALALLVVAAGGLAGVLIARSGSNAASNTPTAPGSQVPGSAVPAVPDAFLATAKSGGEVQLSWVVPSTGPVLTGYDVFRDGTLVAQVAPTLSTYRDVDVAPSNTYTYAVSAVSAGGRSVQATVVVSTPQPPPLSQARVTGGFSIKGSFKKESFTNRDEGDKYTSFWSFKPTCEGDKACGVRTSGEGEGPKKLLHLRIGTYDGTVLIPGGGQCGATKITETQSITFTVKDAAFTDGVWQATKIAGTSRFDVPASPGCLAGFGVVSFTGTVAA